MFLISMISTVQQKAICSKPGCFLQQKFILYWRKPHGKAGSCLRLPKPIMSGAFRNPCLAGGKLLILQHIFSKKECPLRTPKHRLLNKNGLQAGPQEHRRGSTIGEQATLC